MINKKDFLDVDYIGGLGSLSKEDEQKLSEYIKTKKLAQLKTGIVKNDCFASCLATPRNDSEKRKVKNE